MSKGVERAITKGIKGLFIGGPIRGISGFADGLIGGMTEEYLIQRFSK